MRVCTVLLLCAAAAFPATVADRAKERPLEFGVDISFPMQHQQVSTNYPWLPHNADPENNPVPPEFKNMPIQPLGDKQSSYEEFMQSCRDKLEEKTLMCDSSEEHRITQNSQQPKSMKNFTETGVMKIRAPDKLMKLLTEFWERNFGLETVEKYAAGNTFTNHFDVPSYLLDVSNVNFPGGGRGLKKKIWEAASVPIQEWTGQNLVPSSLYGIRIYKEGAILAPHVDRLPLISSAIINVAQDVDEDWPIEVITHDGKAHNITMEPGDLVLYESHSIIHGRPYPLKGRYYANVFIHFQPESGDVNELPPYFIPGTPEAMNWMENMGKFERNVHGRTNLHEAANMGDLKTLQRIVSLNKAEIDAVDSNGWRPLHEAARAGNTEIVEFLIDNGAEINSRTWKEAGGTALHYALQEHGEDHTVVKLLRDRGAVHLHPRQLERDERSRTVIHEAADMGDLKTLQRVVPANKPDIDAKDVNDWRPLHEASRGGHTEVVKFLLDNGAEINSRTWKGTGGTALYYALEQHGEEHPVVKLLRDRGAINVNPVY